MTSTTAQFDGDQHDDDQHDDDRHGGDRPDDAHTPNRATRREGERETKRATKRRGKAGKNGGAELDEAAATREAMRTSLIAQGFDPLVVEAMLPPLQAPKDSYQVRQAVAEAITAMRQDLPRSEKTWAPYLQLLVDGLPDMCRCPCPACASGPCPCPGGADGHADTCAMPADELHTDCAQRYTGVPDLPVKKVARSTLAEAAWWAERRGLKRTVARNQAREQQGRPLLGSDGRGAREQFLQASRWMFSWLSDEEKVKTNPAKKIKLSPRQEAGARSLTDEEFSSGDSGCAFRTWWPASARLSPRRTVCAHASSVGLVSLCPWCHQARAAHVWSITVIDKGGRSSLSSGTVPCSSVASNASTRAAPVSAATIHAPSTGTEVGRATTPRLSHQRRNRLRHCSYVSSDRAARRGLLM
jgi:hypothetical protein